MHESERIKNRMRNLPERFEQRRESGLGGARPLGVAAHAVDHHQEHRMIGGSDCNSVLILFAVADQADIRGLDLQCPLPGFC